MSIISTRNAYTDKDFAAIRARLFTVIRSVFTDWTDESVSNFDNILVELFADIADNLLYYQDNQSRQSRLSDATVRRSVLALASMLGYRSSAAQASQVGLQLTINRPAITDITLPSSLRFRTLDGKGVFRIIDPAIIPAGSSSILVTAENSEPFLETVTPTSQGYQTFTASRSPWVEESEVVTSGAYVYTRVDSLVTSGPQDKHYTITVDGQDRAVLTFGDGLNGFKPTTTISIYYSTGGGTNGVVDAGAVVVCSSKAVQDSALNNYSLSVNNPSKSVGGANRESLASIKKRAPLFARTNARTVSTDDYEINALRVPGVGRALLATSDTAAGLPQNYGKLFVVPVDGGEPTQSMLNAVLKKLTVDYPNTTTFRLDVVAAIYAPVSVTATIYLQPGYSKSTVKAQVVQALTDFFRVVNADGTANENITFGLKYKTVFGQATPAISLSDVYNVVRDTTGVRKIGTTASDFMLGGEHADFSLSYFEFPTLGDVLLRDGDTGEIL